jgi:hypothetical protein
MDQTTNSDYIRFDRHEGSPEGPSEPSEPPVNQGGGGDGTANAELPGVTQQTPSPSDVPPGGDRPVQT